MPVIVRLKESYVVDQGTDLSITCESSGSPYPSIKWIMVGEQMDTNVQQTDNVLRIINAKTKNRGVYVCIAENNYGVDQSSTSIDVERKFLSIGNQSVHSLYIAFLLTKSNFVINEYNDHEAFGFQELLQLANP